MAFSCFLKIVGQHQDWMKGESSIEGHKDWIELHSFRMGAVNPRSHSVSTSGQLSAGRTDFKPIICTKKLDISTTPVLQAMWSNEHIKEFQIDVCRQTKNHELVLKVVSTYALISNYDADASMGAPELTESLTFVFGEVEVQYTRFDAGGKKVGNTMASWSGLENVAKR